MSEQHDDDQNEALRIIVITIVLVGLTALNVFLYFTGTFNGREDAAWLLIVPNVLLGLLWWSYMDGRKGRW